MAGHFVCMSIILPSRNRYVERTSNKQKFNQELVTSMKVTKYARHTS